MAQASQIVKVFYGKMISKRVFLETAFSKSSGNITPRNLYRFIWNFDCSFKIKFSTELRTNFPFYWEFFYKRFST